VDKKTVIVAGISNIIEVDWLKNLSEEIRIA
jgi:hypothetical protein